MTFDSESLELLLRKLPNTVEGGNTWHGHWVPYEKDFNRLPTKYFHKYGPAGKLLKNFNLQGDHRELPMGPGRWSSLVGMSGSSFHFGLVPDNLLGNLGVDVPTPNVGLGAGKLRP